MYRTSIIIPTYNRPKELTDCLKSLLEQTVLPDEVIIVDDANLEQYPLEREFRQAGIDYIYHRKDHQQEAPGVAVSRFSGIALASGDILFFFDDDVVLFPNYLEEILKVYRDQPEGSVGGVGGLIDNHPALGPKDYLRYAIEVLFLANGLREGRLLPSGFSGQLGETPFTSSKVERVDFLSGGVSSFDRKVFANRTYSERYLCGMGEDKDFSLTVAKSWPLYLAPKARLLHLESPVMRANKRKRGRMFITGTYMRFRDYVKKGWWSNFFFGYATCGYILARLVALVVFPNRGKVDQLLGTFDGVKNILAGKVE